MCAAELLQQFAESFKDEPVAVQLQLLTAVVKLFLKRPKAAQELVKQILKQASEESDNPDLRDRGFLYWRLLSTSPEAAKKVVLAEKPPIRDDSHTLDPTILDELISHISSLASVYHKPPETFVPKLRNVQKVRTSPSTTTSSTAKTSKGTKKKSKKGQTEESILDIEEVTQAMKTVNIQNVQPASSSVPDDFGFLTAPKLVEKHLVLPALQGQGLELRAGFTRRDGQIYLDMTFTNHSQQPVGNFIIKFNTNQYVTALFIFRKSPSLSYSRVLIALATFLLISSVSEMLSSFNLYPETESIPLQILPGQTVDYLLRVGVLPQQPGQPVAPLSPLVQAGIGVGAGNFFSQSIPASHTITHISLSHTHKQRVLFYIFHMLAH